jgi:hypothetical protein
MIIGKGGLRRREWMLRAAAGVGTTGLSRVKRTQLTVGQLQYITAYLWVGLQPDTTSGKAFASPTGSTASVTTRMPL